MCGILGSVGRYDLARMERALKLQHHRGPDYTGVYHDTHAFLGHNRLSIIDLTDAGNQPMWFGDLGVVFNGEIYNFQAIREELKPHCVFESDSDTEVLLKAYAHYGIDCFARFNGMFAVAIYDRATHDLVLARDRYGKKPLYWSEWGGQFAFASTMRALLSLRDSQPLIDRQALVEYLGFLSSIAPRTIYEGIHKLPAGSVMVRKAEGAHTIVPFYHLGHTFGTDSNPDELESRLQQAVESRLVADTEVASFLSGGLDSSLISALYAAQASKKIHTFSIGYDAYKQFDETEFAREAAAHIGSEHHELIVGRRDFAGAFEQVLYHLDEPIADAAAIPTYLLSRSVHEAGIKAILSGEGSDELFLGYAKAREFIEGGGESYNTIGFLYDQATLSRLLEPSQFVIPDGDLAGRFPVVENRANWCSLIDLSVWLGEVLMMKMDKMSMAFSLESRAPFLDYRLVDWALGLDPAVRLGDSPKHLLKKIARNYLPERIIMRRKKGFSSPFLYWHLESFGESIWEDLESMNRQLGWFQAAGLREFYERGKTGENAQHLWALIVLARWFHQQQGG